jgi:hypothetical protein
MKIMKLKNIKLLFLAVTALSLSSCLDLEPQDQLGGNKMWTSVSEYKNFANNFYAWTTDFSSVYNDGTPHSDSRSDILTYSSVNVYSKGTNTIPTSDGNYTTDYDHIRRTNLLLKNASEYSRLSDIKQYVGEAYFFRAYSYFDLLELYGNAIIVDKPIDVDDPLMKVARDDRGKVADFIIADLNKAIADLSSNSEFTSDESGRVSKEAAEAFLSRVALYEGTWQKFHNDSIVRAEKLLDIAVNAAKSVIDSKQFYLFGTDGDSKVLGDSAYKYMFILENEKSNPAGIAKSANHEYILSRRHDEILSPIGRNITKEVVNNVQWITRNFANLYLCSDGLPIDKSPLFEGYSKKVSEFQNRDHRMKYSLLQPGSYYWTNRNPHTTWSWSQDLENALYYKGGGYGSGYANQKWGSERSVQDTQEGYDYPVIRYAEVLLNYAEALYERDGAISNEDLDISFNQVRLRSNPDMPKLSNAFVGKNGLDMRTEIRRERTIELYQEGFRLDDLKRWDIAVQVMNQPLLGVKFTGTEYQTNWGSTTLPTQAKDENGCLIMDTNRQWTDKNYLYPLPSDQLQLNPNLKQNPGWE